MLALLIIGDCKIFYFVPVFFGVFGLRTGCLEGFVPLYVGGDDEGDFGECFVGFVPSSIIFLEKLFILFIIIII